MSDPASVAIGLALASSVTSTVQENRAGKAQVRAQRQQADRNLKILERDQKRKEEERRRQLKAALATRRARMGAAGQNSSIGSASAVLRGMTNETNRQIAQDRHDYDVQRQNVSIGLAQAQHQNLLQRQRRNTGLLFEVANAGLRIR